MARVQMSHASTRAKRRALIHLLNERVDVVLAIAGVTTLDEVEELALMEATVGIGELEGPQKVVGLLKVWADGVDLVNQILCADDAVFTKALFNDRIIGYGDALLVDLGITALVDELADGAKRRATVGDIRGDKQKHLLGRGSKLDKGTVVDLEKTKKLQNFSRLGGDLVYTLDTNNERQLGFSGNVKVTSGPGLTTEANQAAFLGPILANVLVSTLENITTLLASDLALLLKRGGLLSNSLFLVLPLFQEGFGDKNLIEGGDSEGDHFDPFLVEGNW